MYSMDWSRRLLAPDNDEPKTRAERTRETSANPLVQSTLLGELFERADIAVLVADQGRYVAANHHACDITGYSREEILGLSVGELNPDSGLPLHFKEIEAGRRESGELTIRRKDGTPLRVGYRAARSSLAAMEVIVGVFWPLDD